MEKFLFSKVPVWLVIVLGLLAFLAAIVFGNIAIHTYKGGTRAGAIGDVVLTISNIPDLAKRATNADTYLRISPDPFPGKDGFGFSYEAGTRTEAGFLLLSRYDGDDQRSYVEFWDLNAQEMVHRWAPPIDEINAISALRTEEVNIAVDKNVRRMLIRHPFVTSEGDILIKSRTPLTRVNACNEIVWLNDDALFHHSLETDLDGNYWTASRIEPTQVQWVDKRRFIDDAITRVSSDGEITLQLSVAQILIDNGLERYVYGRANYTNNPIHLNDVQPVLADGRFWKKDDLFLSLRSHSLIMLYRPETNKILWYKNVPWAHQHDVDILDDHRISIFDNGMIKTGAGHIVPEHSTIQIYNFETDMVSVPWDEALAALEFQTASEGLHRIRSNGNLFAEEQNRGRILELDATGAQVWEYVNRAQNGEVYRVGWSRFLEPEEGAGIKAALEDSKCG